MKQVLILAMCVFLPGFALAQEVIKSEKENFRIVTVAENLEHPWALAFLPNGDMLVTERPGRLNILRKSTGKKEVVTDGPVVAARGQGGLLDVLVHPDFVRNQIIFLSYAGETEWALGTEVVRAKLNGPRLEDMRVIFKAEPKTRGGPLHFGSRLLWGPDGKLYITLGERNMKDQAQDPSNHLGALIRINEDGSVPEDNPFVGKKGYRPEIYSYGHRNVQGIAINPADGKIWEHEHGPKGGDEVNLVKPGANYGWPLTTYGVDYSGLSITDKTEMEGIESPLFHWTPSIAPSGMTFYTGDKFPAWKNNLFAGALALSHLRRVELEGTKAVHQEELLKDMDERIRDVRTGPDGYLYILTDSPEGQLLRLEPAD